ncbi:MULTISPECIES: bifunctional adenosylcobinamide kinase/adenosylcobinamide-phosphate guanylyltransferase [unclassified Acidocella]|uniref:bifunctional adenosylcobinamide kinase/adenosylcobinamide-phosphate guanylyltransferase n=1 Tax=unclassified Acidocella TaxID=2648610 RepID=UPI00028C45F7|nr:MULTISPECIES: bifunctional adenosylcobinamide kinase/adenosylcobinamide-phosphate guanylyltransferase [unclassified Acidocella]EKM98253.1 adenosylcobinamide-phosphate guanylyltransferase [Acidocella sp. MX-AZ02]WBO59386.1 bifunctional adenosylcobinamide kinase/adenosylcobinamide-phosphate guanylyltransferase [Acidocella sp. MX-AZ03]
MILLVTGGARSGKSLYAETRIRDCAGTPVYIATAQAFDAEMAARIAAHKARRGPGWLDVEAPLELPQALQAAPAGPVLVDCLTLWLSNLMFAERDIEAQTEALCAALAARGGEVALVTNEVGQGIVPENALARRFRDAQGRLNQRVAQAADEVRLAVCGYTLRVK